MTGSSKAPTKRTGGSFGRQLEEASLLSVPLTRKIKNVRKGKRKTKLNHWNKGKSVKGLTVGYVR